MPEPDAGTMGRRAEIVSRLRAIVPGDGVIAERDALSAYECDGLTAYRQLPMIVVLPETTEEVQQIVEIANEHGLHLVPSGIFWPQVTCIIGNGVVVDPDVLISELEMIASRGITLRSSA